MCLRIKTHQKKEKNIPKRGKKFTITKNDIKNVTAHPHTSAFCMVGTAAQCFNEGLSRPLLVSPAKETKALSSPSPELQQKSIRHIDT